MERNTVLDRGRKIIYEQDGRCYKSFDSTYNKADVLNEALNQARVEETGLNIPHLLGVDIIDGRWTIISEYIESHNMQKLMDENPDKEDEYLEWFVDIQIDMQKKKCPLLNKHRDKMNRKIGQTDLSATLRYDLHNRIEAMPRHNSLCHGDYNPSNIIVDRQGKAYIIDWSHATQGNIEADSARTFLLFLLDNKKDLAIRYMDLFCKKSGADYHEVLAWLPILAASQSVKGRKNESDFLHKLIFMDKKELEALYGK